MYEATLHQTCELDLVVRVQKFVHQDEDTSRFVVCRAGKVECEPSVCLIAGVMAPVGLLYGYNMKVLAWGLKP